MPRPGPALYASGALLLLAVFVWRDVLVAADDRLEVTVLDVGQGDAILIETAAGQRILVDGGPSGDRLLQALGRELPASVHRIDLMVLTHGQDDHVIGLVDVLERFEVGAVLTSPLAGQTAAYRAWRDAVERHAVPLREAVAGEWVDLGDGLRIEVLGPPAHLIRGSVDDLNNNCVILRLVDGRVSFLLTGDVAAEGEAALLRGAGDLRSTVLKVGHHGSDGSTTPAFLRAVQPDVAVISVGAENLYGHPSPTTLLRLAGVPFLRTDANGRVRFRTDGSSLWVDYDRGAVRELEDASGK
jgi:competence protein ComEC